MTQRTAPDTTSRQARSTLIPEALEDVALIDIRQICAAAGLRPSKWREMVAAGLAPQPAIRVPRFSRWHMADIRRWLAELPQRGLGAEPPPTRGAAAASMARKAGRAAGKTPPTHAEGR